MNTEPEGKEDSLFEIQEGSEVWSIQINQGTDPMDGETLTISTTDGNTFEICVTSNCEMGEIVVTREDVGKMVEALKKFLEHN